MLANILAKTNFPMHSGKNIVTDIYSINYLSYKLSKRI